MAPPHEGRSSGSAAAAVTVDVAAARDLVTPAGGHRYLDVRTEEEMSKLGHVVQGSLNVPYMFITPQGGREKNPLFVEQVASLFTCKDEHVVVGCQSGKRSELACIDLQAAGFRNVKNMGGGYAAWLHNGFPVHHNVPDDSSPSPQHHHLVQSRQPSLERSIE